MPKKQGITKGRLEPGDLDKILKDLPSPPLSVEARKQLEEGLIALFSIFGHLSEVRRRFPPQERREMLGSAKAHAVKLLTLLESGLGLAVVGDHSARLGAGPFPEMTGVNLPSEARDNIRSAIDRSYPAFDLHLLTELTALMNGLRRFTEEADKSIARTRQIEMPSLPEFRLEFTRALAALYKDVFNRPTKHTRGNHWLLFLANVLLVAQLGQDDPIDAHTIWMDAAVSRARVGKKSRRKKPG